MIITTKSGKAFDTARDLTAPERNVLQKLFIWETMAASLEQFREKKRDAFSRGWNDSGPIPESETLKTIVADLEQKVILRLSKTTS